MSTELVPNDSEPLRFDDVRTWIFRDALPFWAEHGVDRARGGFYEELDLDGRPTDCPFKRVRVICRQIYAFSHAALLGWKQGEAVSAMGCEYLFARARLVDGGWARRLSSTGLVIDPTPDLYDLSFVLFAMAWRYKLAREPETRRCAEGVLAFIQTRMRAPAGGFQPSLPNDGVLLQNPIMHLTEACLAAFDATGDERFLDQATELIELLRRRLFDGRTLGERFGQDWRRLPGGALEPGHHFEWVWILRQYSNATGSTVLKEATELAAFADQFGVDPTSQAVYDAVQESGAPLKASSRAWTNTERIKAWVALFELDGRDPRRALHASTRLLLDRYIAPARPGLWVDQFDEAGRPLVEAVPASVLYHLVLAFTEFLRIEAALTKGEDIRAPETAPRT